MALVDYGSSSSDEEEEDTHLDNKTKEIGKPSSGLFTSKASSSSLLPPQPSSSKASSSNKVQIHVPSFEDLDSSSSDDEDQGRFRKTPSTSGSGLKSLLPPPKKMSDSGRIVLPSVMSSSNVITKDRGDRNILEKRPQATTTTLIPHSLKRSAVTAASNASVAKQIKRTLVEDVEDEVHPKSFFSISDDEEMQEESSHNDNGQQPTNPLIPGVELAPQIASHDDHVVDHHDYPAETSTPSTQDLSESQLKKKILNKFGDDILPDNMNLIDVNVNEHMSLNLDYIKTISQERQPEEVDGPSVNSTMKRKHHITYLAHQAKARELALKEEWARNRATRNEAKAKYGFK